MRYSLLVLFLLFFVVSEGTSRFRATPEGIGLPDFSVVDTIGKAFPDGAWGVYSWFGLDKVSQESTPYIKGTPIILRWSKLEPQNGTFEFDKEIRAPLEKLNANDFNTFLMVWVAFATSNVTETDTSWAFTPRWVFNNGVPLVKFPETINPLGNTTKRYFPYYLDEDYRFYFHRMIDSLGTYICTLPDHLRKRILFVQSAEGSTGDGQAYKGEPVDPVYNISKEQWSQFRIETWEQYKSALTLDGELQFPLLTNYDSNEEEQYRWMLDSLPAAIGLKNGMFSHGYHISDAQERLDNFRQFRNEVEATGKTFFARGEQDAEWKTYGWSTQNPRQAFYWSALYATHCGLTMWNVPWEACLGETYADAINTFNHYAAETDPATAKGAFCAFRRGLDASDTETFPEDKFGMAIKSNSQRYIDIAGAFSEYGAKQGDPEKATGGGMVNRKRMDYNDAGWKILRGNYQRHISQIDPEQTSIAWWQMDTSIYGRFARGFDVENHKNTMYFDVDDLYFESNRDRGNGWLKVKIIHFAGDGGSWELKYHAMDGTMKTACAFSNELAKNWLSTEVTIEDAWLDNGGPKGADLILQNTGTSNCRFHMIALEREFMPYEDNHQSAYEGIISSIPGIIEGEHFDEGGEGYAYLDDTIKQGDVNFRPGDNVDVVVKEAARNGYCIGFAEDGEWLEYTVEVCPGKYDMDLIYFCDTIAGELLVSLDSTLLASISGMENKGGNTPDTLTVKDVYIPGGKKKILRLEFAGGAGFEIDAIEFDPVPVPATGISLNQCPVIDLCPGGRHQLYATLTPTDATDKLVFWSSSDVSVARVDSDGWISPVSEGSTVITVTTIDGGYSSRCHITVAAPIVWVNKVSIDNCPKDHLQVGDTCRLFALIDPADATDQAVIWSSSDTDVLKIDEEGLAYAVSQGSSTVTVFTEDGYLYDQCTVSVDAMVNITDRTGGPGMVQIYPIPTKEILNIRFSDSGDEKTVTICNEYGQLLHSGRTCKRNLKIDIREFGSESLLIINVSSREISASFKTLIID